MQTGAPSELRADPVRWGRAVESNAKTYLIGGQGMSLESFFAISARDLL